MNNRKRSSAAPLNWSIGLLLSAVLAGCGGGGGGGTGGTGTLGVSMTDSPSCGFNEVNVTVDKVRVHKSGSAEATDAGWTDITLSTAKKINLLDLTNGALEVLGETPLSAGHYTQLRLVLVPNSIGVPLANSVIPTDGVETALTTPSAVESGIKLIHEFDVLADQRVDLLLDFDACKSIVTRGNGTFALKPVITVIPFVLNGINGFVNMTSPAAISGLRVTAQQNGAIIQTSVPGSGGEFFLYRLAPGNYDVVLTADARATAIITGVTVANTTSVVTLSVTEAPFILPVSLTDTISGTATLNPTSETDFAFVRAMQTTGATSFVTVKFVAASDLSTVPGPGAYSLTLPIGAPWLGTFGALPIVLAPEVGLAGKYSAQASATNYTSSAPVDLDISGGSVIQNFVLVP